VENLRAGSWPRIRRRLALVGGQTKINVVQHALNEAPGVYDKILGVVLNKVDVNGIAKYESYYSQSYRAKYYTECRDLD
jgi:Mrp family chromosome partitioning ATPase